MVASARLFALLLIGFAWGCSSPRAASPSASPDVAVLEGRLDAHESEIVETEEQVRKLDARWSDAARVYREASASYRRAGHDYERARATYDRGSAKFAEAAAQWEIARERWEIARALIMTAASIDVRNLELSKTKRPNLDLEDADCSPMSTRAYRRMLERKGEDLTGRDVDHIVPKSLGGADHPWNYQLLPSSLNRSLGATWNADKCALAGSMCAAAVAISKRCGSFSPP